MLRKVSSHLFTDNVIQVRNTDISFDQRNLIHLFRERPLLDIVFYSYVIVRYWTSLRNKHLLWEERGLHLHRDVLSDMLNTDIFPG